MRATRSYEKLREATRSYEKLREAASELIKYFDQNLLSLLKPYKPELKSVLFALSESMSHNSIFIFATAALSRFGLPLSITAVF